MPLREITEFGKLSQNSSTEDVKVHAIPGTITLEEVRRGLGRCGRRLGLDFSFPRRPSVWQLELEAVS